MAATLLEKQTEQPSLDLNLDRTVRPEAESGGPFWEGDRLKWIGIMNGDCSAYRALEPEIQCSLRAHLISFAHSGKYSAMSYHRAVKALNLSLAQYPTSLFDLAWLVKAITLPSFRSAKGTVESFFKYWLDRYPKAIAGDALQFLARPLALGRRPRNVLSDDPEKSWLTDLEYDTVLNSIWDNYDRGFIGTQSTLLRLLSMQYARRPVQLASLKIGDFRDRFEVGGSTDERCIYFPGAKDNHCFFARHGYKPIKLKSHSARHLLNRLAKQSGVSINVITAWSSRSSNRQSLVYLDNDQGEAAAAVASLMGYGVDDSTKAPIVSVETEVYGQGPIHRSRYGLCRRSWRSGPCNKFADCLNCSEILICKGDRFAANTIAADRENLVKTYNAAQGSEHSRLRANQTSATQEAGTTERLRG